MSSECSHLRSRLSKCYQIYDRRRIGWKQMLMPQPPENTIRESGAFDGVSLEGLSVANQLASSGVTGAVNRTAAAIDLRHALKIPPVGAVTDPR